MNFLQTERGHVRGNISGGWTLIHENIGGSKLDYSFNSGSTTSTSTTDTH